MVIICTLSSGAMTRLTRREISNKLAQVPVFYAVGTNGGIFTDQNVGLIFFDKTDAARSFGGKPVIQT